MNEYGDVTKTINNLLLFKKNINSWSPKDNELKQDDQAYKDKLEEYATTISNLLNKKDEKLIGTFDIESTLLNGKMPHSALSSHNTANPGAIALIRFLKEQKDFQYESSIASIASAEAFDANILLNQKEFFKNNHNQKTGDFTFSVIKTEGTKDSDIKTITDIIYEKVDIKKQPQIKQLLEKINSNIKLSNSLNKKYSVVLEALYRRFILGEENINMLFFDNDIKYIKHEYKGITDFLASKLDDKAADNFRNSNFLDSKLDDKAANTVKDFLTELGITITPICAASGHITFEKKAGEDSNQSRAQAVFLNDLAREVMSKAGLEPNEIDKKMLEAEKICFEEYVSRGKYNKLDDKDEEINEHIADLKRQIADKETLISAPPPPVLAPTVKNNTIVVKKCNTSGSGLLCFMHAAFGEKKDNKYECSDIAKKTEELKQSIIADVNQAFTSDSEADKKRLIEEYTSLVTAEMAATSDDNAKTLLQTSLDTLNDTKTTDNDKKETIINCIDKIKNTFPLIWLRYAAQIATNNIVLISEYNNDRNFHIHDYSVDKSDNDIYIHFDGTGVCHFSRCEKIAYKQKLVADEINVSDIELEQIIEGIYVAQRGEIDKMTNYDPEKITQCLNKIYDIVDNHTKDLQESGIAVDNDFFTKLINKKNEELKKLIELTLKKIIPDKDGIDKIVAGLKDMEVISFDFDKTITRAHSWHVAGLKKDNYFNYELGDDHNMKKSIKKQLFGDDETYINKLKYFFAELQKSRKKVVINSRQYKSNIKDILDYIGIDSTNITIIGRTEQKNNKEESLLEYIKNIDPKKILHLDDDPDEIKKFQKINTYRIDGNDLFVCLKNLKKISINEPTKTIIQQHNIGEPRTSISSMHNKQTYSNDYSISTYRSPNQNTTIYHNDKKKQLDKEYLNKTIYPSADNSFKNDQPVDKNISADYSNPYIAKLKELQEKANKRGIFIRIILAILSCCFSNAAKEKSVIKKLKTISIKNQDEPSYKDDKEMYDLLKKCLDDNKSFVSDIPNEPLINDRIYNHEKQDKGSQTDSKDYDKTQNKTLPVIYATRNNDGTVRSM